MIFIQDKDAVISVRGKPKYVVLEKKRYDELQKIELDMLYLEALNDIKNGNVKVVSAVEHLVEIENGL